MPTYDVLMLNLIDDVINLDFVPVIREIRCGGLESDRMAREMAIDICVENLPTLSKNEKFKALLEDVGELGAAIIAEHVEMYERGNCNKPRHGP